ncbi:MAG: glycosyltransferase family 4 protein [Candidatus Uhrbacteria bacterium]|nr:glycosyltransferase family 4 protein [Candidatus Uhrbacteria bacterium]
MRILLLLNARFPTEKAYGIQTITMAEGYVAAGHDVAIAFPRRTDDVPQPISGVIFLPFGYKVKLHRPWMFHPLRFVGAIMAARVIKSFHPDVVIANDPLQAAVVSKQWPTVWEVHDIPDVKSFERRWLIRRILAQVRAIVSTNELKLEMLKGIRSPLPPSIVLPNAVTFEPVVYHRIERGEARARLGIPADEMSIVYAGQMFDWKGVDTLIKSAEYLSANIVIHLVGGSGSDLERCKQLAGQLPKDSARVIFHGQRPKEEIPFWLRAATLVVIPNSGRFEVSVRDTSPLKLFEALAAEAAIVASDLPSIREAAAMVGAIGINYFFPDDPRALAEALKIAMQASAIPQEPTQLLTAQDRAKMIVKFFHDLPPCPSC